MTSDYREAMDHASEPLPTDNEANRTTRSTKITQDKINMFLESIPEDRFISIETMIKDMIPMGLTRHQILGRLRDFIADDKVIIIHNVTDGRRRLYRRRGVMG